MPYTKGANVSTASAAERCELEAELSHSSSRAWLEEGRYDRHPEPEPELELERCVHRVYLSSCMALIVLGS